MPARGGLYVTMRLTILSTAFPNYRIPTMCKVPDGWTLVPIEPTKEMIETGSYADWVGCIESREGLSILPSAPGDAEDEDITDRKLKGGIWAAMLSAAPKPPKD
ncbi:hypothetical protein P3W85_30025 [Cupriavidus basilensis]|uniref:Uncharacterized protein n=2 Tax=Cupriavidus basilensis TaxID=68895 RepID=A0ABT6AY32_9BURK|nr:hypothetical protein [Cupriavidus basilensis]